MLDLYAAGTSPLHRLPPGAKILGLMLGGSVLFVFDNLPVVVAFLAVVLVLFKVAGFTPRQMWAQLRPTLWILGLLFLVQLYISGIALASFVVLRFAALLLLAGLVTLTTRSSDMIDAITAGLRFLRPLGVNSAKVGLAFSLALRFLPVLATITQEVREAQKTRGLERSILAIAIPVAIRTLRMADDISDAIDARGYRS